MIKEYSVDFNNNTMDFKCYNNYVGDLSQPSRTVNFKKREGISIDEHIKDFIKEFKRQIWVYESNIKGWECHEMTLAIHKDNKIKLVDSKLLGDKILK